MSKYEEIRNYLKKEALKPESRLRMPTVRELMRKFSASQSPVMRAVRELKEAGILDCRAGCGIVSTGSVKTMELQSELDGGKNGKILFLSVDYFSENIWKMEHRLQSYCLQHDLVLMQYKLQQSTNMNHLLSELLKRHVFRGIILLSAANRLSDETISLLEKAKLPAILLDCEFHYDNLPESIAVLHPDSGDMGRKAADYFIRKGHKSIAYIRNEPMVDELEEKKQGFLQMAKEKQIPAFYFSAAIKSWENSMDAAVKVTVDSLPEIRAHGVTAILYTSLSGAFAGIRSILEAGFRIPEDLAVMGGGDIFVAQYAFPPLSAITCDYGKMAQNAIDLILGIHPWTQELAYEYEIIERESSK